MASFARMGVLRQSQVFTSSRRLFFQSATPLHLYRTTPSVLSKSRLFQRPSPAFQAAAFTASAQRSILPPGPQVIQGGVNDPAPVPKPSPTHGSYHWTFERLISLGLVPLTIAPFAASSMNPTIDAVLVFTLLVHSHIGFQACIIDYFPERQHPILRRSMSWILNIATLLVGIGFYEFETNDVGLTESIKRIWTAGNNDATIGKTDLDSYGHDGKLKHLTT